MTSKFLREVADLFVDDEVDVEGLGVGFGMKSFFLKREHLVDGAAKATVDVRLAARDLFNSPPTP